MINRTIVGQLSWKYLQRSTTGLSQWSSRSIYSMIMMPSRGSISDSWCLWLQFQLSLMNILLLTSDYCWYTEAVGSLLIHSGTRVCIACVWSPTAEIWSCTLPLMLLKQRTSLTVRLLQRWSITSNDTDLQCTYMRFERQQWKVDTESVI